MSINQKIHYNGVFIIYSFCNMLSMLELYSVATKNQCTAQLAIRLDRMGLLQFRIVRWLLGINLDEFVKRLTSLSYDVFTMNSLYEKSEILLSKKWKIKADRLNSILKLERDQLSRILKVEREKFRSGPFLYFIGNMETSRQEALDKISKNPSTKTFTVFVNDAIGSPFRIANVPIEAIRVTLDRWSYSSSAKLSLSQPIGLNNCTLCVNQFEYQVLKTFFDFNLCYSFPLRSEEFNYIKKRLCKVETDFQAALILKVLQGYKKKPQRFKPELEMFCKKEIADYLQSNKCSHDNLSILLKEGSDFLDQDQRVLCEALLSNIPSS